MGLQAKFRSLPLSFNQPESAFDASSYTGIGFWAKSGTGRTDVRLKVPDVDTAPKGGVCTECYSDFGAKIALTPVWQYFSFSFSQMKQLPGWGNPRPARIDASRLFDIQWQIKDPSAAGDIWVADIQFIGCN